MFIDWPFSFIFEHNPADWELFTRVEFCIVVSFYGFCAQNQLVGRSIRMKHQLINQLHFYSINIIIFIEAFEIIQRAAMDRTPKYGETRHMNQVFISYFHCVKPMCNKKWTLRGRFRPLATTWPCACGEKVTAYRVVSLVIFLVIY